jgi:TLC domain
MNSKVSLYFTIPMGFGSTYLFFASRYTSSGLLSYFTNNGTYNSEFNLLLYWSVIYFCLDFSWILYKIFTDKQYRFDVNTPLYCLHHVIGLAAAYYVNYYAYFSIKYYLAYMSYELSTPFLNIVNTAHKYNRQSVGIFLCQIIFTLLFTVVRVMFGTLVTFNLIYEILHNDILLKGLIMLPIGLQTLNYWWYYRILRIWYKQFIIFINDKHEDDKSA